MILVVAVSLVLATDVAPSTEREALQVAALPPGAGLVPPLERAGVPLNPLILVPNDEGLELSVEDPGAAIVPSTSASITDATFRTFTRLTLGEDLRPETRYRVVGRVVGDTSGEVRDVTAFTTGSSVDDAAPGDVEVSVDEAGVLSVVADEPLAIVDVKVGGAASTLMAIDDNGFVGTAVFADGSVSVVALDFAGNSSAPVNVEADVAERDVGGCPSCGGAVPLAALTPLLVLPRRRRRRRSGR